MKENFTLKNAFLEMERITEELNLKQNLEEHVKIGHQTPHIHQILFLKSFQMMGLRQIFVEIQMEIQMDLGVTLQTPPRDLNFATFPNVKTIAFIAVEKITGGKFQRRSLVWSVRNGIHKPPILMVTTLQAFQKKISLRITAGIQMENQDHGALLLTQTSAGNTAMFHAVPLIPHRHHRDCSVCLGKESLIEEVSL